jgi:MFS family permease
VLVGRISARIGDRAMSNVGLASLTAAFALVAFVHGLPLLSATMLLFSFGMALTNTGITALISNTASDREQGTVLGTSSSLDSLSGIVAPPFSTGILAAFGPDFAGIQSLVLAALALVMGVRNGRDEARVAVADDAALRLAPEIEAAKIADG